MPEFQKSLIRFMYVALIAAGLITSLALFRPMPRQNPGFAGDGGYGPTAQGITTTGTCVVRTKPELVEITLGVWQSSPTASKAKNYVKSTCQKIIAGLLKGGVAAKDIQTQDFRLFSQWDSGRTGVGNNSRSWQVIKWRSEETLRVRVRKMDTVAELIDAAAKAGANKIGSLDYTVDNLNEIRSKGRAKASAIARAKAQELASQLGGKLGKLVKCSEGYPGASNDYYGGYYGGYNDSFNYGRGYSAAKAQLSMSMDRPSPESPDASGAEELTIQAGEMVTTVVVTATYELD
ncbi:MAG: SIMPL domain-containing protein [Armatimonadetes bacterium]|nr:SIMPL domain-containing protein [Armatimonadota bacterium]